MKKNYQSPSTEQVYLHGKDLMIPSVTNQSGRESGGIANPGMAPGRTMYS